MNDTTPLTDDEMNVVASFIEYKPFYRKIVFERNDVPAALIDGLVTRGLIKRNRAGATQITDAGRAAVVGHYVSFRY